jgi:hypothetical protein
MRQKLHAGLDLRDDLRTPKGAKRREIKMTTKAITSESTIKAFRFKAAALNFINTHFPEDDSITIIYRDGFYEVVVYETVFCVAN